MATALKRYNGGRVLVFVVSAFAEMSEDISTAQKRKYVQENGNKYEKTA